MMDLRFLEFISKVMAKEYGTVNEIGQFYFMWKIYYWFSLATMTRLCGNKGKNTLYKYSNNENIPYQF